MADGLIDARNRELAESLWGDVERLRKAGDNNMIVSATDYTAEVETRFRDLRESSLLFLNKALNS